MLEQRIAIYPPVGRRGIDRLLNFVAGRGDGDVYADSIRPAVPEQLFYSLGRMWLYQLGR